jgi:hypothetical protein
MVRTRPRLVDKLAALVQHNDAFLHATHACSVRTLRPPSWQARGAASSSGSSSTAGGVTSKDRERERENTEGRWTSSPSYSTGNKTPVDRIGCVRFRYPLAEAKLPRPAERNATGRGFAGAFFFVFPSRPPAELSCPTKSTSQSSATKR